MLISHGKRLLAAISAVAATCSLPPPSAGGASGETVCSYLEAGAPGPADNVLRIEDTTNSVIHVYRQGDEIVVFNNLDRDPTACGGGTPTVFNVDRIELTTTGSAPFFNYIGGGSLAPGATPETSGSEIEVSVHEDYQPEVLNVGGSPGSDSIAVGQVGAHQVGVNLNAQADGANPDADYVLDAPDPSQVTVKIVGKKGDDRITALGGGGFSGPFPADGISFAGGAGNDTLIGGPHRDHLRGDDGNDLILGGRGRDLLKVGPGRDLAKGGQGADRIENESGAGGVADDTMPDRVFGGPGNDRIEVAQLTGPLPGDFVDCGAGHRDAVGIDPGDHTRNCERVDVVRRRVGTR